MDYIWEAFGREFPRRPGNPDVDADAVSRLVGLVHHAADVHSTSDISTLTSRFVICGIDFEVRHGLRGSFCIYTTVVRQIAFTSANSSTMRVDVVTCIVGR